MKKVVLEAGEVWSLLEGSEVGLVGLVGLVSLVSLVEVAEGVMRTEMGVFQRLRTVGMGEQCGEKLVDARRRCEGSGKVKGVIVSLLQALFKHSGV